MNVISTLQKELEAAGYEFEQHEGVWRCRDSNDHLQPPIVEHKCLGDCIFNAAKLLGVQP